MIVQKRRFQKFSVLAGLIGALLLWILLSANGADTGISALNNRCEQMQKLQGIPKVYVYSVPDRLLLQGIPSNFAYDQSLCRQDPGYSIEYEYHTLLNLSGPHVIVTDPSLADAYFIPHYSTCFMQHCFFGRQEDRYPVTTFEYDSETRTSEFCLHAYPKYLLTIVDYIRLQSPFFNLSKGADHFMAVGHETLAESLYFHQPIKEYLQHTILLQVNSLLRYNENSGHANFKSYSFDPHKDIAVAPNLHDQYMKYDVHSRPPRQDRKYLVYFRGQINHQYPHYSHGIRQYLAKLNDSRFLIGEGAPADVYLQEIIQARFCLYPPGWTTWSGRLAHIIYTSCVPLIINDGAVMPYEEILDWRQFSVKLSEQKVSKLPDIIDQIEKQYGAQLERRFIEARESLVYNYPPREGDALFMALRILKKRLFKHKHLAFVDFNTE
ncbi:hypothetical protein MP228_003558 [Amoeboaphelidium protococcarum]|nr:hypothetical protein MP228_003558 [Amoeboaphelidium protococcarum]